MISKLLIYFYIISGVLWRGDTPLKGSVHVINRLKELGKKVFLVSNNCTLTLDGYMMKAKKFGINVTEVG
jgi:ribonucleotide monophosphatase NagD (HAD superfamily)